MAWLKANDYSVSEGSITVPRRGRMVAELRIAAPASKTPIPEDSPVTLTFQDGYTIRGRCVWAGEDSGIWRVKVVGGSNRLHIEPRPKYYAGIAARSVLSDLLLEVGETPGRLDIAGVFERYVRMKEPAHLALETLLHAKFPGYVWRTNAAGAVDVLKDTWAAAEPLTVSETYPAERRAVCLPRPSLLPGVTLPGVGRLDSVRHVVGPQLRTEVFYL